MIDILMATYNGEKYVAEQIDSILNQTNSDWVLIIQDDCSTDSTAEIALEYARRFPEKIKLIERETPSGSAKNNFFSMLSLSKAEYCMTCDQDDVWLPEKIEVTLKAMRQMEEIHGVEAPLLVHTDLKVVDVQLKVLSGLLCKSQDLSPDRDGFNQILVQNIVSGCTMMVNKALLAYIKEIPKYAIMHDWWLALVASAFGHISFIDAPTILYRQHGANQVGAKDAHSFSYNWARFRDRVAAKTVLRDTYVQAGEFFEIYNGSLDDGAKQMLQVYSTLAERRKLARIYILLKYRLLKNNLVRKIAQLIFV